ncbi:MAG: hypothetical protein AMXMBFR76_05040 [Pseudomonadota bacterium]|jgi:uncharacterized protein YqiB (DUF1249 family)
MALYEQNYAALCHLLGTRGPYPSGGVARPGRLPALYLSVLERERFTTTYHLTHRFGEACAPQPLPDLELRVYHDARQCEALRFPAPAFRRGNPLLEPSERWAINVMLGKWLRLCLDRGYRFGGDCPPQVSRSHAAGSQRPD